MWYGITYTYAGASDQTVAFGPARQPFCPQNQHNKYWPQDVYGSHVSKKELHYISVLKLSDSVVVIFSERM